MENFDNRSVKYMVAVIAIALIFVIIIGNAFKYLPDNESKNRVDSQESQQEEVVSDNYKNEEIQSEKYDNDEGYDDSYKDKYAELKSKKYDKFDRPVREEKDKYIEIENDNLSATSQNLSKPDIFDNAKKLRAEKKYETAIIEYLNIADISSDDEVKAQCYDEVATIYAVMKRYNQAITYAQKSCNIKPTGERTILLSRIYYQAGQKIKAEEKIQAMLQKGFE